MTEQTDPTPEFIPRMLQLPDLIADAEQEALHSAMTAAAAENALGDREAQLLLEGVEGKNEADRKAALRLATGTLRSIAEGRRNDLAACRINADRLKHELKVRVSVCNYLASRSST